MKTHSIVSLNDTRHSTLTQSCNIYNSVSHVMHLSKDNVIKTKSWSLIKIFSFVILLIYLCYEFHGDSYGTFHLDILNLYLNFVQKNN